MTAPDSSHHHGPGHGADGQQPPPGTGQAPTMTIGLGRDDPRQWVQAAYTVTDAIEGGQTGPGGKLPTRSELARTLGISQETAARAYRELADLGIACLVPGHGYFPARQGRP
jgi:DNA-binding GntR family transcriptional regulator